MKLSPYTAVQWSIIKKDPLRSSSGKFMHAFIKVKEEEAGIAYLLRKGCRIGSRTEEIVTAAIPCDRLEEIASDSLIEYIDAARKMTVAMDSVVISSDVQPLYDGRYLPQAYTGKGVVVGVVDIGFDYTHPNFYDATGNTYRIKSVWEQSKDREADDESISLVNYGVEYMTKADILKAKCSSDLSQLHGSHTLGIAAGSGFTTPYRGIAYEGDINLVSTDLYNDHITDGINYIFKQARNQGKPCVINVSLGMRTGPHDGTTLQEQSFNKACGTGKIIVAAAGNNRYYQNHVYKSEECDTLRTIVTRTTRTDSIIEVDTWSTGAFPIDSFSVRIALMEKDSVGNYQMTSVTNPYSSASEASMDTIMTNADGSRSYDFYLYAERNGYNNRYNIYASIMLPKQRCLNSANLDDDDLFLVSVIGKNISAHSYCDVNDKFENLDNDEWAKPIEEGCIDSPGSATRVVTVGAYTARNRYTNQHGDLLSSGSAIGNIASFSSLGPTADGRIKPDITAPGVNVISSFNSFCTNNYNSSTITTASFSDRHYSWGVMSGTSMSTPVVTGIIALWLEADPTLTPERIKEILSRTAKQDTANSYPNDMWGYGKIDAYAGLLDILNLTSNERIDSFVSPSATVFPRNDAVVVQLAHAPAFAVRVYVYGLDGKLIASAGSQGQSSTQLTVQMDHPKGIYAVRIDSDDRTVRGSSLIRF